MEEKNVAQNLEKVSSAKPTDKKTSGIKASDIKNTIREIIQDPDVKEMLEKLGLDDRDVAEILDVKKISINPTSKDDVDSFSKSVLKYEVMSVLLQKQREQILDEKDAEMRQASTEFTKNYKVSLRQGRVNRLIAVIDKYGGLPSKDGKTYIPLTAEQKEELRAMLQQTEMDMSEFTDLIDSIEFEYEDAEPELEKEEVQPEAEFENTEVQTEQEFENGEPEHEETDTGPEFENEEVQPDTEFENEEVNEGAPNITEDNILEPGEPAKENEDKEFSLEENGLRKVNDADKLSVINKNEELQTGKYRTATFYIPEKTMDLDTLAGLALEQKRNNPGENVVIMFGTTPIIPEKFTSKAQIIDACRADIVRQQEEVQNTIEETSTTVQQELGERPELQQAIDNTTSEVIAGQDTLASLQENAITIQQEAIEAQIIQNPRANEKEQQEELSQEDDGIDPRESKGHYGARGLDD